MYGMLLAEDIEDIIKDFIEDMLESWCRANLKDMFSLINDKVASITSDVSMTPSSYNSDILDNVKSLSDNVIIPIAGIIITFVLCYELIHMVMDKNNMHDFDTSLFFRYLIKAFVGVWFVSNSFDITMAIFDVGNHITSRAGWITGGVIDVDAEIMELMARSDLGIGDLLGLGLETMVVKLGMHIMTIIIFIIVHGRMLEIYLYISVSPIPFATLTNREWGSIGNNYFKGLLALAFQGFFIIVLVSIYTVLVSNIAIADNVHAAVWSTAGYCILLCFSLLKTSSLSKSIFNAH